MTVPSSPVTRQKQPYGHSFPVSELLTVRDWAEVHGMTMQVVMDHVLDGAAFEELLLLRHRKSGQRLLCLWRRADQVIAQRPDRSPFVFRTLAAALAAMEPASAAKSRATGLRGWLARVAGR